jgi:hypothetical protein
MGHRSSRDFVKPPPAVSGTPWLPFESVGEAVVTVVGIMPVTSAQILVFARMVCNVCDSN